MRKLSVLLLAITPLSLAVCAVAQHEHHAPAANTVAANSSDAGGHYEMGLVEAHAGNAAGERTELGKAVELWKSADPDLEELVQARKMLAELSASASSVKR